MMRLSQRIIALLLSLTLWTIAALPSSALAVENTYPAAILEASRKYRSLTVDDTGDDVLALKERLAQLGYFSTGTVFSKTYSQATADAIYQFQQSNALSPTGIADPVTQAILFSEEAVPLVQVSAAISRAAPAATAAPKAQTYIGNKNTKKFHYPWCSSVNQMKDKNKVSLTSRSAAIDAGYVPCKKCNP